MPAHGPGQRVPVRSDVGKRKPGRPAKGMACPVAPWGIIHYVDKPPIRLYQQCFSMAHVVWTNRTTWAILLLGCFGVVRQQPLRRPLERSGIGESGLRLGSEDQRGA